MAYGVSGNGSITVGKSSSSAGERGVAWIKLGRDILKRRFEPAAPYTSSEIHDTSMALAVGVIRRQDGISTITQAASVHPTRGSRILQPLPGGSRSEARGVNNDGTVIVGWGAPSTAELHAVLWRKNPSSGTFVIEDLGVLHDGRSSKAHGVSGNGNIVVGERTTTDGSHRAFWWVRGRTPEPMQDLGTLPRLTFSEAFDVTSDGNVVVGLSGLHDRVERKLKRHAFRWKEGEGMLDLGVLP